MFNIRDRPVPGPTYMSKEQKAHYLDDLRGNRSARPSGSRPLPPSKFTSLRRTETTANLAAHASDERPSLQTSNSMPIVPARLETQQRKDTNTSARGPFAGRPLARPPSTLSMKDRELNSTEEPPTAEIPIVTYMERGTRWMEKQETKSLRRALENMDLEGEKKVHSSAQDEAAELVWKHQNPEAAKANEEAPYANPDIKRDYRSHLRKGSYTRSHSEDAASIVAQRRTVSGSSTESGSSGRNSVATKHRSVDMLRKVSPPSGNVLVKKFRTASGKSFGGLAEAVADDIAKAHRRTSSGSNKRILSGEKKAFMHPKDRIWEDPEEDRASPAQMQRPRLDPPKTSVPSQPAHIRKNPFARVRMQAAKLERSNSEPIIPTTMPHSVEIQRNPPSQSKKPWYMSNEPLPPTPPSAGDRAADEVSPKGTPTKDGKELRSDDIRAATSKQRKDYSPKLPRPTAVSDKPGRPIVSFKQDWRSREVVMEEVQTGPSGRRESEPSKPGSVFGQQGVGRTMADVPQIFVDEAPRPPIPIINLPDDAAIPSIVLPEEPGQAAPAHRQSAPATPAICIEPPQFNVQPPAVQINGQRPSPSIQSSNQRPLPRHAATSPLPKSSPHYTPSFLQSGALCAHCALPIAGRILSAAGERFHPGCFVCHDCHTNLELVAFYPEPEKQRSERVARITCRHAGLPLAEQETMSDEEAFQQEIADGDTALRFYCHLDFHELFSPRCKSCKTPIEGEVIVACGAEWHAGHFFCAQCGDPFDSSTPFVEKDGYAWCVGCHTNRYSAKCRKCRKPVTETVVKALGFEWHADCFVCTECNGEFQDKRYFLRGESQDPVCVRCEERRLKA